VSQPPPAPSPVNRLWSLEPVPTLLKRLQAELAVDFPPGKAIRLSRAPGRLDVMGGSTDYTGSLVCQAPLDRAAAVAIQSRQDRNVQVFSFNLLDDHQPFTARIPLDALADFCIDSGGQSPHRSLCAEFNQPGRRWAGYLAGCVAILHHHRQVDLKNPSIRGINLALLSTVPLGAGVGSSAAIEVAAMINVMDHFQIRGSDPMALASLCREVENRVVGAPCGIMDQLSSCAGQEGSLLRLLCQPDEVQSPLHLPPGIRIVGISSGVKPGAGGGMNAKTRCAAFMGHRIILEKMRDLGRAAGATLQSDPMRGYLANLEPQDYKKFFRPFLPERLDGKSFLAQYGPIHDTAAPVDPDHAYHVVQATDHHVLEAMRVRNFVHHLETAAAMPRNSPQRKLPLDKAGHLMYASHLSYTNDALLGAEECDALVQLVRNRRAAGLYGAKITGAGCGGTVAVLTDIGPQTDAALAEIISDYEKQTGRKPEAFLGSSPGAWEVGTVGVSL
jgi:galactokinase